VCSYSVVAQEYIDRGAGWWRPVTPTFVPIEVDELRRRIEELEAALGRAHAHDKASGQADCPDIEKKAAPRSLAEHWGLIIAFPDEATAASNDELPLNEWTV